MKPHVSNIEYIVPSSDKPVGSISFGIEVPVLHKEGQKEVAEADSKDVVLSEETVSLMKKLSLSVVNDLEK